MNEEYGRLLVWVEVEAGFNEYECTKMTDEQFGRAIAERIMSGSVKPRIVKCSTIFPPTKEVTA